MDGVRIVKTRGFVPDGSKLVYYELCKVFSSRLVKALLCVLLILNVVLCAFSAHTESFTVDKYYEIAYEMYLDDPERFFSEYERLNDEFEQYERGKGTLSTAYSGGVLPDIYLFRYAYTIAKAEDAYHEDIGRIVKTAEGIARFYENADRTDEYVYRHNKKTAEIYGALDKTVSFDGRRVTGWEEYFAYNSDFFVVLIFLSVTVVFISTCDRQGGFLLIMSACKRGRRVTAVSKLAASAIVSAASAVLFTASTFITAGVAAGGYSSPANAAQAVTELIHMPYGMSLSDALAADVGLIILASVVFSAVLFALTSVIKHGALCVGAGVGIAALSFAVPNVLEAAGSWRFLNLWSAYYIARFAPEYRSLDIAGHAVDLMSALFVSAALIFALSLLISAVFHPKNFGRVSSLLSRVKVGGGARAERKRSSAERGSFRAGSLSLVYYELYKQRAVYALLAAAVVLKLISAAEYYKPAASVADDTLKKYISEIGGEFTEEKAEYIEKKFASSERASAMFDTIFDDYMHGKISQEYYNRLFEEYMEALNDHDALKYLSERTAYLRELYETRGIVGSYIYDTGYYVFVNRGADFLLLLFVVVLCCRSYLCECAGGSDSSQMLVISGTTRRGRGMLMRRKAGLCIISSASAWFVFRMTDLYFFMRSYDMPDMSAPITSMPRYGGDLLGLSISGYIVFTMFASMAGTLIIASVCFCMGFYLKKALPVYALSAAVIIIPHLAAEAGVGAASFFDVTSLNDADRLYRLSSANLPMPVYGVLFAATAAVFAIVLSVTAARKAERGGCI